MFDSTLKNINKMKHRIKLLSPKHVDEMQKRIEALSSQEHRIHPFVSQAIDYLSEGYPLLEYKQDRALPNVLEGLFTHHGSDKETIHSYSMIYSVLLREVLGPHILEIG